MPPPRDVAESPHKGHRGLRRLVNAFFFSLSGLALALRHESAFRQEIALATVLLPIALLLPITPAEQVLLEITHAGVCHSDLHIWEGEYDLGSRGKMRLTDRGVSMADSVRRYVDHTLARLDPVRSGG